MYSRLKQRLKQTATAAAFACTAAMNVIPGSANAATAMRSQDFLNGLGVNTHTIYTDSQYRNVNSTISALQYLGVKLIRDTAPNPANQGQTTYAQLAKAGITMDLVNGGDAPGGTQNVATALSAIAALAATYPGSVHAIEGPNEVNNGPVSYAGLIGVQGAQAYQNSLYNTARVTPALAKIPVYNFTDYPDATSQADYANFHSYPSGLQSCTGGGLTRDRQSQLNVMPGHQIVNTELGASTQPQPGSFDQTSHARFLISCALDNASAGVRETYFYQLFDGYTDPNGTNSQDHFGLFDSAYNPKVAATAIRHVVTIVGEAGANETTFTPGAMTYSISGPSTVSTTLMQKASGWWVIAIWNEAPLYSEANGGTALNPSSTIQVKLPRKAQQVWVNDAITGSAYNIANTATPSFTLGGDPLFLVISPN